MIGLDSSAIIDFADGDESLKRVLEKIKEPLVVNKICYLEIMLGIDLNDENYKFEEDFYHNFFQNLKNFDLDMESCKKASRIFHNLKKEGNIIEAFDCTIAGICLTNGVKKIITKNIEHFKRIKGIEVIGY